MAKRLLARVQGASIFYYNNDASSLNIDNDSLSPIDIVPMIGDALVDNTGTMYTIVDISETSIVLGLATKSLLLDNTTAIEELQNSKQDVISDLDTIRSNASDAKTQAGENATAIEKLQTDLAGKADASDLDDYEKTTDLEGDVDKILEGKDYATKDDLETVEGTATEALQKATDLEETANIGMRLCFNDKGYPCVEYLISEV